MSFIGLVKHTGIHSKEELDRLQRFDLVELIVESKEDPELFYDEMCAFFHGFSKKGDAAFVSYVMNDLGHVLIYVTPREQIRFEEGRLVLNEERSNLHMLDQNHPLHDPFVETYIVGTDRIIHNSYKS